jgi:gamma-D-glutamyl-L-lysine dipeptidyl-peptidase
MDGQLHLQKTKLQIGLLTLTLLCGVTFLALKERAYFSISSRPVSADLDTAQTPISTKTPVQKPSIYVNEPVIDVYSEPVAGAETVTQALYGEPITVIEQREGWLQVSLPDQFNYKGWLRTSQVKASAFPIDLSKLKIVATPSTPVYVMPQQGSAVITSLSLGARIESIPQRSKPGFTTVQLINGQKGYIRSSTLMDHGSSLQASGEDIQNTAIQLLGQPYLWGGMTTAGVDCSGFVHTVFKVNGIKLHRDADQQFFNDGIKVEESELKSGDLVFFETYAPGPSHVGIYIGNNKFIQAGSSGVSYASLTSPYFADRFVGAKRILNIH